MSEDQQRMNISGNQGQINFSSGQSQMKNTMNVYSKGISEELSQLHVAIEELMEKLQQSEQIEERDKQGTISLLEQVQKDISANQPPNQGILHVLNQNLERHLPLMTGVSAANSTISAINDFKDVVTPFLGG